METATKMLHTSPEAPSVETVCFVCTGNTCRSPMAQAYLNAEKGDRALRVLSAGLAPIVGEPIAPNAVAALQKAGIEPAADDPYPDHRAQALDEITALSCDRIVCMTPGQAMQLMLRYPAIASRIGSMPEPIPDPYGGTAEDYERCLAAIARGIRTLFLL